MRWLLTVTFLAGAPLACGPTPRAMTSTSGQGIGAHCEVDSACDEGLFCGRGGVAERLCTETCADKGECAARFGDGVVCHLSACVPRCENDQNCTFGTHCDPVALACVRELDD